MTTTSEELDLGILSARVPEDKRIYVLPKHFPRCFSIFEQGIYTMMSELCPTYKGGYWHYQELNNGGMYMLLDTEATRDGARPAIALRSDQLLRINVDGNGYSGDMSPDAACLVVNLMVMSSLSFRVRDSGVMSEHFYWLRDFAMAHEESKEIFAAID